MTSMLHHEQTLEVRPEFYEGLLVSTCSVLGAHAAADEFEMWQALEAELRTLVRDAAS